MKRYIAEGLEKYLNGEHYPWHMPGHKRKSIPRDSGDGYSTGKAQNIDSILNSAIAMDVTEVPGTDDLHHPEDMIKASMEELAKVYGTYASYYLVNGSTCGILAAISACFSGNDERLQKNDYDIIVAGNCHKSVYNAVKLLGLTSVYVNPVWNNNTELPKHAASECCCDSGCRTALPEMEGFIDSDAIEKICREHKKIRAMVLTSPNYTGVVSDIEKISRVLKKNNIVLIVDEAHGAHLPFMSETPKSAISCGADIVVQSIHKTLPSLTQTALLHVMNSELDRSIRRYLSVYMSSSPSYVLLCSMERAAAWAAEKDYDDYLDCLKGFRAKAADLKSIKIVDRKDVLYAGAFDYDDTRIVITTIYNKNSCSCGDFGNVKNRYVTGTFIESRLYELGSIVSEMSGMDYVVLISTAMDDRDDFDRLYLTLKKLDDEITGYMADVKNYEADKEAVYLPETDISEAAIEKLVGTRAEDNVYVYPPGSYLIARGEMISADIAKKIIEYIRAGKKVWGILQ